MYTDTVSSHISKQIVKVEHGPGVAHLEASSVDTPDPSLLAAVHLRRGAFCWPMLRSLSTVPWLAPYATRSASSAWVLFPDLIDRKQDIQAFWSGETRVQSVAKDWHSRSWRWEALKAISLWGWETRDLGDVLWNQRYRRTGRVLTFAFREKETWLALDDWVQMDV